MPNIKPFLLETTKNGFLFALWITFIECYTYPILVLYLSITFIINPIFIMNLFKKSFVLFSTLSLFLFVSGIMFIPSKKVEATIAVTVTANNVVNSLAVNSGAQVEIRWSAPAATSCTNNFNSSTSKNSYYEYTATSATPIRTFTVNCTSPDTVKACYEGFWTNPDPVHPTGGSVTYVNAAGSTVTLNYVWSSPIVTIYYRIGTTPSSQGAVRITCP